MKNKLYLVRIGLYDYGKSQVGGYPDLYVCAVSKDEAETKAWDYGRKNYGRNSVSETIFINEIKEPFII